MKLATVEFLRRESKGMLNNMEGGQILYYIFTHVLYRNTLILVSFN